MATAATGRVGTQLEARFCFSPKYRDLKNSSDHMNSYQNQTNRENLMIQILHDTSEKEYLSIAENGMLLGERFVKQFDCLSIVTPGNPTGASVRCAVFTVAE